MARPVSIQDDALLESARKVFLKRGFRATTAEVAKQAGVSEGSLFKRFPTKSALFMAAMNVETNAHLWQDGLIDSVGKGDMREALESAGLHLLKQMQLLFPRIMMIHSSGITVATDYYLPNKPPAIENLQIMARYFRAEMKLGRFVCAEPDVQAHAFLGALHHYVVCDFLHHYRPAAPGAYVREVVQALLRAGRPVRISRRMKGGAQPK